MKKKLFTAIVAAITASMMILSGCGKEKNIESKKIVFGTLPAESAIPIIVAKEKGFFEKQGVEVELQAFNSPFDRDAAVQAGKIDGIIADVMTSLVYHNAGVGMKITSDINEDFKLLTSPKSGIDSFDKLNNKDVSIVPNYVLEYIMDEMAAKNNIKYKIVTIPSISARFEALLADKVSAVVFTEPQSTMLKQRGAKVLASSKEYGLKAGAILFNEKTLKENSNGVKEFYAAYNEAIDYINKTDASEYSDILKKYTFPDSVTQYLKGEAKYSKAEKITEDSFNSVMKWTRNKNLISKELNFQDISDFKFIK